MSNVAQRISHIRKVIYSNPSAVNFDQYQYLSNCPPTPPLTKQQSIDNKLRLMLGLGRGRWAVAQILILILAVNFPWPVVKVFRFLAHAAQQSFHDVISNIHFKNSFFD